MNNARKNLKLYSFVVLAVAVFNFIGVLSYVLFGDLNNAVIPADASENLLLITKIVLLSLVALFMIPDLYVGIKGLRIAKKPDSSASAHIVWAFILMGVVIVSMINTIVSIVTQGFTKDNVGTVLILLVDAAVYFDYIKYARAVKAGK